MIIKILASLYINVLLIKIKMADFKCLIKQFLTVVFFNYLINLLAIIQKNGRNIFINIEAIKAN